MKLKGSAEGSLSPIDMVLPSEMEVAKIEVTPGPTCPTTSDPVPTPTSIKPGKRIALTSVPISAIKRPSPSRIFEKMLPMTTAANHFMEEYQKHPTIILMGETGSGKSTQVPQIIFGLLKSLNVPKFRIAVTQPRRIAAVTLAARVQQELNQSFLAKKYGVRTDGIVGHKVRFDSSVTDLTKITFMTEGILLQESIRDRNLSNYDVIIVDEAHERSMNTDLVLGIVKTAQQIRSKEALLKIVVMTATGDADKFFSFFPDSKVLLVSGKMFPVQVEHLEEDPDDYLSTTISKVIDLHTTLPPKKHILVFLTGQEEIEGSVRQLNALKNCCPLIACPLYASLPKSQQEKAFELPPTGTRKIVVATNMAETSVTIPGIKIVVDCGHVKSRYYMGSCLEALQVHRISQSQSQQRAGRAGRQSSGKVCRMFTKEVFDKMEQFDMPEVMRSDLSSLLLILAALEFQSIEEFPFLDAPDSSAVKDARKELESMGALDESETGLVLTQAGKLIAQLPVEPKLAYVICSSVNWGVVLEIVTIIAMIEADTIFLSNHDEREQAVNQYWAPEGDFATYLNIYRGFKKSKAPSAWCRNNKINLRSMKYAVKVREQLQKQIGKGDVNTPNSDEELKEVLTTVFARSLPQNRAELNPCGRYYTIKNLTHHHSCIRARIHPSSALARSTPPRIVFTKLTLNESQEVFMHHCALIDSKVDKKIATGPPCKTVKILALNKKNKN